MSAPSASSLLSRPVTNARAAASSGLSLYRKRRGSDVSEVDPTRFKSILNRYDDDEVFVHAGLSDVKAAFNTNPYELLRDTLDEYFESILAPGFTPSFKQSGVFHREYTRPQYGAFSRLFLDDADYRTDDPLHSIEVSGPYRFDDCNTRNTFGPDGTFAQLEADDALYLNVGIPRFHCSQLHYLECRYDVPYIEQTDYEGIVYHGESDYEEVVQTNFRNENPHLYAFNRTKIRDRLEEAGALDAYDLDGLPVYVTRAKAVRDVLGPEIEADPFYLVS